MLQDANLYKILYHILLTQIYTRHLKYGETLPSLKSLCMQYNMGIATVRKAVALLQKNHYILVSKGKKAVVIYDNDNPEYIKKSRETIALRKQSILSTYETLCLLLPDVVVQAAINYHKDSLNAMLQLYSAEDNTVPNSGHTLQQIDQFLRRLISSLNNPLLIDLHIQTNLFIATPFINGISFMMPNKDLPSSRQILKTITSFIMKEDYAALKTYVTQICHSIKNEATICLAALPSHAPMHESISFFWLVSKIRIPLYGEITKTIMKKISIGVYKNGDFLPPITALAKEYRISEITARSAISLLSALGLVQTINGRGTRVDLDNAINSQRIIQNPFIRNTLMSYFQALQIVTMTCDTFLSYALPTLTPEDYEMILIQTGPIESLPNEALFSFHFSLLSEILQMLPPGSLRHIYHQLFDFITWGRYLQFCNFQDKETLNEILRKNLTIIEHFRQRNFPAFIQSTREQNHFIFQRIRLTLARIGLDGAHSLANIHVPAASQN